MIDKVISNDVEANPYLDRSISHATMRSIDLLDSFLPVLEELDREGKFRAVVEEGNDFLAMVKLIENGRLPEDALDLQDAGMFISQFINETLFDAMGEFAPEGYYFGATMGDGSDYGFWKDEENYYQ